MKYFNVTKTNIPYETAMSKYKLIQLEENSKIGDVFGEYILCSTGNSIIVIDGELFDYDEYFKSGMYVNLFPLDYIDVIESDNGELDIEGFIVYKDEKVFHPLLGFDKDENEILDLDKAKETVMKNHYYIREK